MDKRYANADSWLLTHLVLPESTLPGISERHMPRGILLRGFAVEQQQTITKVMARLTLRQAGNGDTQWTVTYVDKTYGEVSFTGNDWQFMAVASILGIHPEDITPMWNRLMEAPTENEFEAGLEVVEPDISASVKVTCTVELCNPNFNVFGLAESSKSSS
jgi:hypothetical protein